MTPRRAHVSYASMHLLCAARVSTGNYWESDSCLRLAVTRSLQARKLVAAVGAIIRPVANGADAPHRSVGAHKPTVLSFAIRTKPFVPSIHWAVVAAVADLDLVHQMDLIVADHTPATPDLVRAIGTFNDLVAADAVRACITAIECVATAKPPFEGLLGRQRTFNEADWRWIWGEGTACHFAGGYLGDGSGQTIDVVADLLTVGDQFNGASPPSTAGGFAEAPPAPPVPPAADGVPRSHAAAIDKRLHVNRTKDLGNFTIRE